MIVFGMQCIQSKDINLRQFNLFKTMRIYQSFHHSPKLLTIRCDLLMNFSYETWVTMESLWHFVKCALVFFHK